MMLGWGDLSKFKFEYESNQTVGIALNPLKINKNIF